ncbi:MAG TPA: adenylate/guanylate cyclase domain-containing protein [Nocardioidaceae bacterium]
MADHGPTLEQIRASLTGESPILAAQRKRFRHLPSDPRCKLCLVPFRGPGAMAMKRMGFGQSPGNPSMCSKCISAMRARGVTGLEIPVTLVFSDVRGSTSLGERMRPTEFRDFLGHFYDLATRAILEHDGIVDKIVGDEVIGLFFGGISGPQHTAAGVAAALDLAERAGRTDATPMGPIPAGTGVHTGDAFVGATSLGDAVEDFTALGDAVNTTARLAASAAAGEVLISAAAAEAAGRPTEALERRSLPVRGRSQPVEVVIERPGVATT